MSVSRACMAAIHRLALPPQAFPAKSLAKKSCALAVEPKHHSPLSWIWHQPYLLLSLTSLFWAGNIVLMRYVAGHIPPITLSFVRWIAAFLLLWPFARQHFAKDWLVLRAKLPLLVLLSAVGFAYNNAISNMSMQYTSALNALLIQSSGPLFIALWSLILFRVQLTAAQLAGIAISLLGVLTIILRGDFSALASIHFNKGDLMFASAVLAFGLYSALMARRPAAHPLSLLCFTMGCGAVLLLPLSIWEYVSGFTMKADALTAATLAYLVIFPSALAYMFLNRGIALIGPNRASPFLHLVPVFGSAMAILLLGEEPHLFHLAGYVLVLAGVIIASRRS
jgi:drug/metabolite transporter (DMT)-like permease